MLNHKLNKRYVVITSPEQKQSLRQESVGQESLELATCLNCEDGTELLIYRDNFIAYKVATLTGGEVRPGTIVIGGITAEGDLTLEDGTHLRLGNAEVATSLS